MYQSINSLSSSPSIPLFQHTAPEEKTLLQLLVYSQKCYQNNLTGSRDMADREEVAGTWNNIMIVGEI